jgi:hypothetical protein
MDRHGGAERDDRNLARRFGARATDMPPLPSFDERVRKRAQPVAPDRTALASGLSGLALAAISVPARALLAGSLADRAARPTWAALVFALASLAGFGLGVLAIWSAVKAWLREDALSVPARWGAALGLAAILLVGAIGPCGPQSCPR